MLHTRQHITDTAHICYQKGMNHIVISPGSRSAPLIRAFYEVFGDSCISIVDERSAAFFALGLAIQTQKPVALICTSGTALLNYAPALAEAYYQHVPLLAITADRPREWIDQQENQTLRQPGIYANYIKGNYELPQQVISPDDLWYAHRIVNQAINLCMTPDHGPVHINVPLAEPLYETLPPVSKDLRIFRHIIPEACLTLPQEMTEEWNQAQRIMIVHGQDHPGSETSDLLPLLLNDPRIIILAENISNISHPDILHNSNLLLSNGRNNSPDYPDLLIHSGGHVVSKALAGYLRRASGIKCWRIGTEKSTLDTFRNVTCHIPCTPGVFYRMLSSMVNPKSDSSYAATWKRIAGIVNEAAAKAIHQAAFSDLRVFNTLFRLIPPGSGIALGNSSIVRYAQLFQAQSSVCYYANRGVSGIDGCISTAAGIASASDWLIIAITGDLGFLYDSNALWNRNLSEKLRIIVINNEGGGIFHIMKGPAEQPSFKNLIEAHHPVNIHKLAAAFGLLYFGAGSEKEILEQWDPFIHSEGKAAILEIKTQASVSADIFRKIMEINA